jgi:hypothetical protein
MKDDLFKRLGKKTTRPRAPGAVIALYGVDDDARHVSKIVVSIHGDNDIEDMETWDLGIGNSFDLDDIAMEIAEYLDRYGIRTIYAPDGVVGCPHGDVEMDDAGRKLCSDPACAFWAGKTHDDRIKSKKILVLARWKTHTVKEAA